MSGNLWREIWILIGIALASLMLAEITGYTFLIAALGFGLYIAANLRNLVQLNRWLVNKREDVPDARGRGGESRARTPVRHCHTARQRETHYQPGASAGIRRLPGQG